MADYPDWVMKHKTKGTYVNCVKGRYYLYAAHSERVPGSKKVRRVSDGYIGRITEEDGLIRARDKVAGGIAVFERGLCMALHSLCSDVAKGLRREFRAAADKVLVAGLLAAAYGDSGQDAYQWSCLSLKYPGLDMRSLTAKQRVGAERCARMARDQLGRRFGEAAAEAAALLPRICVARANGRLYQAQVAGGTMEWLKSHGVEWSDFYGEEDTGDGGADQGIHARPQPRPPRRRGRPKKAGDQAAAVLQDGQGREGAEEDRIPSS